MLIDKEKKEVGEGGKEDKKKAMLKAHQISREMCRSVCILFLIFYDYLHFSIYFLICMLDPT